MSRICITWINLLYYELKDIFPFPTQELVRKNMPEEFAEFATTRIIALIRDDVTKISRNVKPRLGGDRFAWFVDVLGKIFRCSCFSLFVRNASMVYCLRLYKLFRHGNQKVLASLTAGEQRTAFQMACKNSTNEHAS